MKHMRTTITLDPDVEELVRRAMTERGLSFKEAVNEGLRMGMRPARAGDAPAFPTFRMGTPRIELTKALAVAAELEDDELARRLVVGR